MPDYSLDCDMTKEIVLAVFFLSTDCCLQPSKRYKNVEPLYYTDGTTSDNSGEYPCYPNFELGLSYLEERIGPSTNCYD